MLHYAVIHQIVETDQEVGSHSDAALHRYLIQETEKTSVRSLLCVGRNQIDGSVVLSIAHVAKCLLQECTHYYSCKIFIGRLYVPNYCPCVIITCTCGSKSMLRACVYPVMCDRLKSLFSTLLRCTTHL